MKDASPTAVPFLPTLRAALVLVVTLAFVISPYLTDGFSGFDPDLFPIPQRNPPVQPAGYAFGIWGLIYLWLIAMAVTGLVARRDDPAWDAPRRALIVSLGVGSAWIAVANASAVWATVLIWAMLAGALVALWRVPQGDGLSRWLGAAPVAIYAGWLTAASCVSVGLMLAGYGVVGPVAAALLALVLAIVIAVSAQIRLGRAALYGLTVIWALVGVVVANIDGAGVVAVAAGAGIAVMVATIWHAAADRQARGFLAGVRW